MPVLGMGGLFFRARDPEALGQWYRTHLHVGGGCVVRLLQAERRGAEERCCGC